MLEESSRKWVLEQMKPEISLEANMTKLKLSYFGHIMRRQSPLEKAMMPGKIEGRRRRGRLKCVRLTDSTEEATGISPQELSRPVRTGHCDVTHSFTGPPGVGADSTTHNIHTSLLGTFCELVSRA